MIHGSRSFFPSPRSHPEATRRTDSLSGQLVFKILIGPALPLQRFRKPYSPEGAVRLGPLAAQLCLHEACAPPLDNRLGHGYPFIHRPPSSCILSPNRQSMDCYDPSYYQFSRKARPARNSQVHVARQSRRGARRRAATAQPQTVDKLRGAANSEPTSLSSTILRRLARRRPTLS